MSTRRRAWWVLPLVVTVCVGIAGYVVLVRPPQQEITSLRTQIASFRSQGLAATQQIAEADRVARIPLPVGPTGFDRLWPEVVQRAGTLGYTVDSITFSPGPSVQGSTLLVTVRLTGPYLALDDTCAMVSQLVPLWSWRTLQITVPQESHAIDVTVAGALPLAGAAASTAGPGVVQRPPLPGAGQAPAQGPNMPPPPPQSPPTAPGRKL